MPQTRHDFFDREWLLGEERHNLFLARIAFAWEFDGLTSWPCRRNVLVPGGFNSLLVGHVTSAECCAWSGI
jgi:hypothetical protein